MTSLVLILVILLSALFLAVDAQTYDWRFGNTSVWLSAAAYCDTSTYLTRIFKMYSAGFEVTEVIDDKKQDVQGFIGYLSTKESIFVVFRGSTSIGDWVNNLDAILTSYPKCNDCQVHKGFYIAQQSVTAQVTAAVKALRQQFPSYKVVVTGHSLGAAVATLTALDLMDAGIPSVRLFHFGSPRVGNTAFAEYASKVITDRNRNTHHKDMVVHVPMHERFTHISGEWYEDDSGLHLCSGLEDPKCSYQWYVTSIDDHMNYLGLYMSCDSV